ncbi:unnamed protein product [Lampetra planeri]
MSTTSNISWVTSLDPNRTAWANHSERGNASKVLEPCSNTSLYFTATWDTFTSATPVLILTAFALGLVLNLAVLLVYALHHGAQTVADVYVTNLTVAELLLVVNLPFWATAVKQGLNWPFGDFMCRATNAVLYVNKYASVFFLTAVSLDQHQVICKTMQSHAKRRVSRVRLRCVALWLCSLLLGLPVVIFRNVRPLPENDLPAVCFLDYPSPAWNVVNRILLDVLGFVLPFTTIGVCGFRIRRSLLRSRVSTRSGGELVASGARDQERSRAIVAISTVVVGFFVCWFPFHFNSCCGWLLKTDVLADKCWWELLWNLCSQISTYFGFLNSCVNPALYFTASRAFQRKALQVLRCRRDQASNSSSIASKSRSRAEHASVGHTSSQASSSM